MKILMFFPGRVHHLPPLITAAGCMADCGARVRVLAFGAEGPAAESLRARGVELISVSHRHPRTAPGKALLWLRAFVRFMQNQREMAPDCIWQHQSHFISWYAFLPRLRRDTIRVLHSHELTCHVWARWVTQKASARRAEAVITAEANRSLILKHFSGSQAQFMVVPNRPVDLEKSPGAGQAKTAAAFREHGGAPQCRRFLIYQGAFMPSRCLQQAVRAFKKVPHADAGLILMGGEPNSSIYRELVTLAADDRRIVLLPRIAPPRHLEITAGCMGGIILYAPGSLNSIYCAPNKIYEYASFGLGMILPYYPGMATLNHEYRLGATCDPTSPDSIASAMKTVLQGSGAEYRQACRRFLASADRPTDLFKSVYAMLEQMIHERHASKKAA